MKLSLIFLVFCLVATTFGQHLFYWPFPSFPSAVSSKFRSGHYWPSHYYQDDQIGDDFDDIEPEQDMFPRTKLMTPSVNNKRRPDQKNKFQDDQARRLYQTRSTYTSITATYATTTTITQTSVRTCFRNISFISALPDS